MLVVLRDGVYEVAYWMFCFLYLFAFSYRVTGRRNIPASGPILFIANHQSFLDPMAVGLTIRRPLSYLARKPLFKNPVMGAILRLVNCVPIDQDGLGKDGLLAIVAKLKEGRPVLVFPEGSRTWDGSIAQLMPGVTLILKRLDVPVVPVGIAGAYQAWPRHRAFPLPGPLYRPANHRCIAVAVGTARHPKELKGLSRDELIALMTEDLVACVRRAEQLRRKPA